MSRVISGGTGLIFKGSGFYLTDYKNKDSKKITKKITTNISKEIILYSTIGNKITIDKKDPKVPDGINLIYPAKDKDTKKLANFIICYMNY